MIPDPRDPGLISSIPEIRRARGYRLYDRAGRRFLDLWQGHGSAILGHRASGVSTLMKGVISRGLTADLPSGGRRALQRELRELLPTHPHARLYGSLEGCLEALSRLRGSPVRAADIHDPAVPGGEAEPEIAAWRPGAPPGSWERSRVLVPVLPFSLGGAPWAACFREEPPLESQLVSELVLAPAARSLRALRRYPPGSAGAALQSLGLGRWMVSGIYVSPAFDRGAYPAVFLAFLAGGVILSPRFEAPSILPAELSPGELAALVGLFRANPLE